MKTFLANLKHHVRTREPLFLGGGEFHVHELEKVLKSIEVLQNISQMLSVCATEGDETAKHIFRQAYFIKTVKALREYDDGFQERARLWDTASTKIEIDHADRVGKEAAEKVCRAYYQDTKAFNTLEACMDTSVSDIRRLISVLPKGEPMKKD